MFHWYHPDAVIIKNSILKAASRLSIPFALQIDHIYQDIVPTKDFRRYLLKKYSGYVPGIITNNRRTIAGTESYGAFKTRMRDIDGTGEFVVEIG